MQPALQATSHAERSGRGESDRGQPVRRSAGGEMHRVLIRIPDFRDPAPLPAAQPITTLPLSQETQTFIVHQAHSALQAHFGQQGRSKPLANTSTIIAAPPTGEIPVVQPPIHAQSSINTAAIDAVVGADADDEDEEELEAAFESTSRSRRKVRHDGASHAKAFGRWVSELDVDDVQRMGRKLSVLVTVWRWMQTPRVMLTALGALLVQMTGLAVLLEMQGSPSTPPPDPKSPLAPVSTVQPVTTPPAWPAPQSRPAPTFAPQSTGELIAPPTSGGKNPLPEGPLTPTPAPPRTAQPIQTPLNSAPLTPGTSTGQRLSNDPQNELPWEVKPSPAERPIATPMVPDASATRSRAAAQMGALPAKKTGTRLGPSLELPQQEGSR
ncbi:MAG: hypothetical protein JNM18_16440 [Planctomycetaceae bacterium]|nr:hypothetical protein [Planctomycetaceae bacterium]